MMANGLTGFCIDARHLRRVDELGVIHQLLPGSLIATLGLQMHMSGNDPKHPMTLTSGM